MKVKIKCSDGEIRTPKECLETEKSIPEPILKKVLEGFLKEKKKNDRWRFGTTRLTSKCLRQSFYQLTEEQILELEKLWVLSRGHAFHNHFSFEENEKFVEHKFEDFDVIGFIDGIEKNAMYELKTTSNIPAKAQEHHALQAQAYYSMYPDKEKIDKLLIVYLSMNSIKTFEIPKRDIIPWLEQRGRQLTAALKTNTPPPREKNWLCSYCPFEDICKNNTVEKKESVKNAVNKIITQKKELKKAEAWRDMFNCC